MGSGSSGSYTGTSGGSQPYAETYSVVDAELSKDKKDTDIYNPSSGYFKNPTAINIEDAAGKDSVRVDSKRPEGQITYVLDKGGNIIIGTRKNPNNSDKRAPHPTLIGGKNPEVQCAGMITFKKGKIVAVNNHSGHFRPNSQSMPKVYDALKKLYNKNPNLFHKDFKWE